MKKLFLKHCKIYRAIISKLFGKYKVREIIIPFEIYGNFEYCYLGFDKDGNVKKGFKSLIDALKNRGSLGLTVLYDYYI